MKKSQLILLSGLLIGILYQLMVSGSPPGIGLFLFTTGFIAFALMIAVKLNKLNLRELDANFYMIALLIVAPPIVRDTMWVIVLYLLFIPFGLLAIVDELSLVERVRFSSGLLQAVGRSLILPFSLLASFSSTVMKFTSELGESKVKLPSRPALNQTLFGVLIAIPVLMIFTAIFSQADPYFYEMISNAIESISIDFDYEHLDDIVRVVMVGGLAAAFYGMIHLKRDALQSVMLKVKLPKIEIFSSTTFATFFGLLSGLFIFFIFVQFKHLFGGDSQVLADGAQFTFSEYARRGFGELLVSSLLVIGVSAGMLALRKKDSEEKITMLPFYLLVFSALIIGFSAQYRLYITEMYYGYTTVRIVGHLIMLAIMAGLILLLIAFKRSDPLKFLNRAALSVILTLLVAIFCIPLDRLVAEANWRIYRETGKIDLHYVLSLGGEARSVNLRMAEKSPDSGMAQQIKQRYSYLLEDYERNTDWRRMNIYTKEVEKGE